MQATMPSVLWTTLRREGNLYKSGVGSSQRDLVERGIVAARAWAYKTMARNKQRDGERRE